MEFRDYAKFSDYVGIGIMVGLFFGIAHLIYYLLTKGVIWIAYELFNVNYYSKFWVVYVAVFLFNFLIKGLITVNNRK